MPAVKPTDIIEQQLERLKIQSEKGMLTYDETKALEALIKLQIVLRMKGVDAAAEDPFENMTTEELKALLPHLT